MFFTNFNKLFNELNKMEESFFSKNGDWVEKTYKSPDGSLTFTYLTKGTSKPSEIETLKMDLDVAVENQNFEMAVELRDKIKTLEKNKEKISELKKELGESIKSQNFERSIEIRDELKSLTK